jgi:hypothetical protein
MLIFAAFSSYGQQNKTISTPLSVSLQDPSILFDEIVIDDVDTKERSNEWAESISLQVYPSPVRENLHIDLGNDDDLDTDLLIFNAEGKLVDRLYVADKMVTYDVSQLPFGNYFIQLINKEQKRKSRALPFTVID